MDAENMDATTDRVRSRRSLIAVGAAAIGVTVADALARPEHASATQGQPLIAGQANTETSQTSISNTATGDGLTVTGGAGENDIGIVGIGGGLGHGAGVVGASTFAAGVSGGGDPGVFGLGVGTGPGVHGHGGAGGDGGPGVLGEGENLAPGVKGVGLDGGTGVRGEGGGTGGGVVGIGGGQGGVGVAGVGGLGNAGVFGIGGDSSLPGETKAGIGVRGKSGGGHGTGVYGHTDSAAGLGVWADNEAGGVCCSKSER